MTAHPRKARALLLATLTAGFLLVGTGAASACHEGPFSFPFPSPFPEPPSGHAAPATTG